MTTSGDEKFIQMTTEPVEKLIGRLAVPSIVIMLISSLYNMADTYFVSNLGTSATGAVGVVFSLMALIQALGFFFGHGSGNYISRQLGAQNEAAAVRMASTGFFSAWITGAVVAVAGLLFREQLVGFLGATETIAPYAREYIFYILLGAPWMASSLVLNNQLRFQGSAFYGMIGMTTGAVLNIALDPILIFVLDMGVAGAGLATAISQMVSCCILYVCTNRGGNIAISFRKFSPSLQIYKEVLRGGFPSLCRQGIGSFSIIILNHIAGNYGDAAIAAISIVNRVTMFASSALLGFGQGFQPVCGFNYGAKRYDRVRRSFWFCLKLSTCILVTLAILGAIFAPGIISLFQQDDMEVVRIGTLALRLQCLVFPLMGLAILSNMMLQTIGLAARASLLAASRQGIFLVPALLLLPRLFDLLGLQLCQPTADFCSFLVAIPLTASTLRELKQLEQQENTRV